MYNKVTGYSDVYLLAGNSHKLHLSTLRDENTTRKEFVATSDRISTILLEGALGFEEMVTEKRKAPTGCFYDHYMLQNPKICYVSVLRSAEAMLNRTYQLADDVSQGFVLIQRDEKTHQPQYFYHKFPKDLSTRICYIVDPMLATGGSGCKCIELLIEEGVPEHNIRFINIITCHQGIANLKFLYPDVRVFTAVIDPVLNDKKYIEPGLGDFGDRYFNTC